jgi:hypothetical protein
MKYIRIFYSTALQNVPKLGFFVLQKCHLANPDENEMGKMTQLAQLNFTFMLNVEDSMVLTLPLAFQNARIFTLGGSFTGPTTPM